MNEPADPKQENDRTGGIAGPAPTKGGRQEKDSDTTEHADKASGQNKPATNRVMSWRQRWHKTSLGNKWLIAATIVIAVANLSYVIVAVFQLLEMRSGSSDTRALAVAAGKQAEAAGKQAKASETQAQAMLIEIQTAQAGVQATQEGVKATMAGVQTAQIQATIAMEALKSSKATLDASIATSRADQRAWLGVSDNTYTLAATGPIESSVTVTNSGKSPAIDLLCRITGTTTVKAHVLSDTDIVYPSDLPTLKQGTIFPNQHFPLKAGGTPMDATKQERWFENVKSGEFLQYFFGEVRYRDAFGKDHWTHFCSQFVPTTKGGAPCPVYNDTDDSNRK